MTVGWTKSIIIPESLWNFITVTFLQQFRFIASWEEGTDFPMPHSIPRLPGGLGSKESAYNAGDPALTPEMGRSPGETNGYPLQYSYLENSKDRGAWWWGIVHGGGKELNTTERL